MHTNYAAPFPSAYVRCVPDRPSPYPECQGVDGRYGALGSPRSPSAAPEPWERPGPGYQPGDAPFVIRMPALSDPSDPIQHGCCDGPGGGPYSGGRADELPDVLIDIPETLSQQLRLRAGVELLLERLDRRQPTPEQVDAFCALLRHADVTHPDDLQTLVDHADFRDRLRSSMTGIASYLMSFGAATWVGLGVKAIPAIGPALAPVVSNTLAGAGHAVAEQISLRAGLGPRFEAIGPMHAPRACSISKAAFRDFMVRDAPFTVFVLGFVAATGLSGTLGLGAIGGTALRFGLGLPSTVLTGQFSRSADATKPLWAQALIDAEPEARRALVDNLYKPRGAAAIEEVRAWATAATNYLRALGQEGRSELALWRDAAASPEGGIARTLALVPNMASRLTAEALKRGSTGAALAGVMADIAMIGGWFGRRQLAELMRGSCLSGAPRIQPQPLTREDAADPARV